MVAVVANDQHEPQLAWFLTAGTHPVVRQSFSPMVVTFLFMVCSTSRGVSAVLFLNIIKLSNSLAVQVEN